MAEQNIIAKNAMEEIYVNMVDKKMASVNFVN